METRSSQMRKRTRVYSGGHRVIASIGAALVLAVLSIGVMPANDAHAGQPSSEAWDIFNRLNAHRVADGLPKVKMSPGMVDVAKGWADNIAAMRQVPNEHNPNLKRDINRVFGGTWTRGSENAGSGPTIEGLDLAWKLSAVHWANVTARDFTYVGIGVTRGSDGYLYAVVDFVAASDGQTTIQPGITRAEATALVQGAYTDFLGRPPTSGEASSNIEALISGSTSVAQFIGMLATSDAWAGTIITGFYQGMLGRNPDPGGYGYWMNELRRGRTTANIAANFYGSNENYQAAGGNMTDWLTALYRAILDRTPDQSGLNYWTSQRARGVTLDRIAYRIYQSDESLRDRVDALYAKLLGRAPDAAGRTYWMNRLRSTGNDLELAISLARSDEYLRRAMQRY